MADFYGKYVFMNSPVHSWIAKAGHIRDWLHKLVGLPSHEYLASIENKSSMIRSSPVNMYGMFRQTDTPSEQKRNKPTILIIFIITLYIIAIWFPWQWTVLYTDFLLYTSY